MASDMVDNSIRRSWLYHPKFPEHWTRKTLYSLATWVNGLAFRNIQFSADGMPVIKIAEIKSGITGQTKFTQQIFDESVHVKHGDMLFSWSGQPETSIDVFWWYGPEGWLNQHVFRVTPAACVDRTFFYYLLRYLNPNFVGIASNKQTTGLGHVTKHDLDDIEVAYPGIREQRAIAHILGTLDDKIELNRRMNRTLEEMAQAIFKSWFVDFNPVRAKMEGRWKKGETLPGLPADLWDAFPGRLVSSELGEIPEEWAISTIGDMVQVLGGGTPSTKNPAYWEGGTHPFCTPKDMASLTNPVLLQTERYITEEGLAKVSSGQLPVGTVLLSSRAPIGYLAVAETPVSVNQGIIAMVCDARLPNLYVLHWAKENMDRVLAKANGSTFMEISKRDFRPINAVIPSPQVLQCFMQVLTPMHQRVVSSLRQIQYLADLRDSLLPKLISGELVVKEAERIVGRAI